jgi:CcmD family protein
MKKFALTIMAFVLSISLFAQGSTGSVFTDYQKYYVTAAVLGIIIAGVLVYLFMLDRRVKKLEEKK